MDGALVLLHHPVDHGQPQAGAFADFFRGEKRLEDMLLHLRGNALACIRNAEYYVASGLDLKTGFP